MERSERKRASNFAEFYGSFFINFTLHNVNFGNTTFAPFVAGVVFFISVFLAARISGGHLNAAVTLSVYLNNRKRNPSEAFDKYAWEIIYQVFGGLLAGFVTYSMGFNLIELDISPKISYFEAGVLEGFFTVLLCLCHANMSDPNFPSTDPVTSGIIVGAIIFLTNMTLLEVTGGIINPSVAISLSLSRAIFITPDGMAIMWLYIIAPIVGAFISHWFYYRFMQKEIARRAILRKEPRSESPERVF